MPDKQKLFGGEGAEQYQAVYDAIEACGKDYRRTDEPYAVYAWLHEMPRTSLTVELVDKLREMGFKIVKA